MVNMKLAALVAVSAAQMGDNFAPALEQPRKLQEGATAEADKKALLTILEEQAGNHNAALSKEELTAKANGYYDALAAKFENNTAEMKKVLTKENVTTLFEGAKKELDIVERLETSGFYTSFQKKLEDLKAKLSAWSASFKTNFTKRFEEAKKKVSEAEQAALIKVHGEIEALITGGDVETEEGKAALVASLEKVKADTTDKPAQDFVAQEIAELSAGPEGEEKPNNAAMLSFSALLFCVVMSF